MTNISGFGLRVRIVASKTFPAGFTVSQFADDADPIDSPTIDNGDSAMGANGDLVTWQKPQVIKRTINVIPGTADDRNLAVLAEANRVGKGKMSVQDIITMTIIAPSGKSETLTQGALVGFMPGLSVASAGRQKTKPYMFVFENMVTAG